LALSDLRDVAPGGAVLGVLVVLAHVAVRDGGDDMNLQRGDKVMIGGVDWAVYAVALGCFYVVPPDYASCPPKKADYALVTHVWRGSEWVPISQPEAG
jgi:hypothetical protein